MSIIDSIEGVAQSISVNHYEKYIDQAFIQSVREDVLVNKANTNAKTALLHFSVDCLNMAQVYILDIARQQHQTSELSISSITLRNALIYFLSEQIVSMSQYLHYSKTDVEKDMMLYEYFPKLLASLHMLHQKNDFLPCFLQTQNMQKQYKESILPYLQITDTLEKP